MYKNRHFVILLSCLVCMGVLLWSYSSFGQSGENGGRGGGMVGWSEAVTAIAQGEPIDRGKDPESMVRNFWQHLDLRQIDLAKSVLAQEMLDRADAEELFVLFLDNPLISIQSVSVAATDVSQRYLVKMKWNSVISEREDKVYFCDVDYVDGQWLIVDWIKT